MKNIIELVNKEKLNEMGYQNDYDSVYKVYIIEDLTLAEKIELPFLIDFEIDLNNNGTFFIKDLQGEWDFLSNESFSTLNATLDRMKHIFLGYGIALITKSEFEIVKKR